MTRAEKAALGLVLAVAVAGYALIWAQTSAGAGVPRATPLSVANAAWPGSPCAGRIRVYEVPHLSSPLNIAEASGVHVGGPGTNDNWTLYSCDVAVLRSYWRATDRYERCQILVHEAGHLAGQRHQRRGIMRPDHNAYVRACAAL